MMVRTQVSLDGEAHRRAREKATQLGISLAEYIRRLIDRDLQGPEHSGDVRVVFDLGGSGGSDVARHKDAMVAESYERKKRRRR